MEALKGIHPVSDGALFEKNLTHEEKIELIKKINKSPDKSFDNPHKLKAARLGYWNEDSVHVYYQFRKGVSGFMVYYSHLHQQIKYIQWLIQNTVSVMEIDGLPIIYR